MGNIKDIFKILLVIQIICSVFASYGNPDAETIDFGLDPSRDQFIIEAAIKRGMDGDAVAELLRTKQPVVKTVTSPSGVTKTTTYKLDDDGSISSKTVTQSRKSYTYNTGSIPDDLSNSPSGTVTRTFTDENGHKVTQTISVDKPKPSTVLDTDDLTGDWFSKPFPRWQHEEPSTSVHRTLTRTFTGPNGERRTVQSWSSDPDFNEPHATVTTSQSPPSTYHTVTRTFIGPNGEKRVVQVTNPNQDEIPFPQPKKPQPFPSFNTDSWPGFDFSGVSQPWGSPDTDTEDSDDWTVVEGNSDVETAPKKKFETWTPKTWNWPEFPTFTTTTTAKPKLFIESELPTPKPLPNLDDFLKSQYGPATTVKTQTSTVKATTTSRTPSNTPKSFIATTTKKPVHINLEDLPVTQVFHNGKPADEGILKNLPPHLKPQNPDFFNTEKILKIDHKHPIEDDVEVFSPKEKTSITTIKKTHTGPEKPTIQDLDPHMQEILKNAGISPEDITNIDGDTITKTRTEPDGRKITTTYKVQTVPVSTTVHKETTPVLHRTPVAATNHSANKPKVAMHTPYKPLHAAQIPPLTPLSFEYSPISAFLAKLGLTKSDISSQNGRLSQTFIDDGGQVLTVTFALSSPMSKRSVPELKDKPIK